METIRIFVKTDEIPDAGLHAKGDPKPLNIYASLIALVIELFDLTRHLHENPIPEFRAALRETVDATNELFTKFVQLGGDKQSSILHNRAFPECQQAQNEVRSHCGHFNHPCIDNPDLVFAPTIRTQHAQNEIG